MATVKRIEPGPALKLGAIIYAFLGLIIGVFMACFSLVAGSLSGGSGIGMGARAFGFGMGVGAIIVAPIVYGIIGESARRLRRWCITLRLDGWAGSRWTSANQSTIEPARARKWQRLRVLAGIRPGRKKK